MELKELLDRLKELKGVAFLSPREEWFVSRVISEGFSPEVVFEAVSKFLNSQPEQRRQKVPIYLCYKLLTKMRKGLPLWRERFEEKLNYAILVGAKAQLFEPKDEESAERFLLELEQKLALELLKKLSKGERLKIAKTFSAFKDSQELYKDLVRREILKLFGIKPFSLYID
ncbi:MAG: hypothetical protein NZL90_00375 [Aquificaceae bacterium]|nr:hypothetical protein [Aquificaceae bacterium]MDW8237601.1 hypothetical protein [Aquificaceae bacterium]